jgi:hypothetical protein
MRRILWLFSSAKYNLGPPPPPLLAAMPRVSRRAALEPKPSVFPFVEGFPTRKVTTPVVVTLRIVRLSPTYIIEGSPESVQMP